MKREILDQFFTLQHIYIYMLWSYSLVQVLPFALLLSGPSLFLTLFVKNTMK